jgi:hypothetical protein
MAARAAGGGGAVCAADGAGSGGASGAGGGAAGGAAADAAELDLAAADDESAEAEADYTELAAAAAAAHASAAGDAPVLSNVREFICSQIAERMGGPRAEAAAAALRSTPAMSTERVRFSWTIFGAYLVFCAALLAGGVNGGVDVSLAVAWAVDSLYGLVWRVGTTVVTHAAYAAAAAGEAEVAAAAAAAAAASANGVDEIVCMHNGIVILMNNPVDPVMMRATGRGSRRNPRNYFDINSANLANTGLTLANVLSILLTGALDASREAVATKARIPVWDLWPFVRRGCGTGVYAAAECFRGMW